MPATSEALGGWAVAPPVVVNAASPLVVVLRLTLTGNSAPETAVGGFAVIAPKASEAAPAPVRSGGSCAGLPAAISVARSWAGLRSGRFWESAAAIAATRAAATALPPATTGLPPAPTVRALPAAARSGLGRPPAVGPWEVLGEIFAVGGASEVGPRSVSAKAMSVPGLALRSSLAASPVTPITGAAARPAAIAGSGSSPGAAITTARAPTAAAAAAWAAGLAPALTITTLSRMRVRALPRVAVSVSVTGPAVWPPGGGSPASTAAWASSFPSSVSFVRGAGSSPVSAPTASESRADAGEPIGPASGRGGALVARGRDDERAEARGALDRLGLGRAREARRRAR